MLYEKHSVQIIVSHLVCLAPTLLRLTHTRVIIIVVKDFIGLRLIFLSLVYCRQLLLKFLLVLTLIILVCRLFLVLQAFLNP